MCISLVSDGTRCMGLLSHVPLRHFVTPPPAEDIKERNLKAPYFFDRDKDVRVVPPLDGVLTLLSPS